MAASRRDFLLTVTAANAAGLTPVGGAMNLKHIVFLAGAKSHGYGQHEHPAGCRLMARLLESGLPGVVRTTICDGGWPKDERVFDNASSVVMFFDGGDNHPTVRHPAVFRELLKRKVGLCALHYALVVPPGPAGEIMLDAMGGYYEPHWSVNPFWVATFENLAVHPASRGVKPFAIYDEWYFHMRFRGKVTPLLTARPPDKLREQPFGPHSGNPTVLAEKGREEHMSWVHERPGGGRGFGFTGCHYHWSLGDRNFRNLVLNGIAWTAGLEIPEQGVAPADPSWEELLANVQGQSPEGFGPENARAILKGRRDP